MNVRGQGPTLGLYVWDGEGDADVPLSPNVQAQLVGPPVLVSVKLTVSGAVPVTGVAVKLAVGAVVLGPVTSNTKTAWDMGSVAGRTPVSAPSVTSTWSPMTSTARVSRRPKPVRLMPFHPVKRVRVVIDAR